MTDTAIGATARRTAVSQILGRTTLIAAMAVFATACASGGGSETTAPPQPVPTGATSETTAPGSDFTLGEALPASAEVTLDEAAARAAVIGPAGGTIEANGPDGRTYALNIPPGLLADDLDITMTPIADLRSPVLTDFHGGVQLEPSGLLFAGSAELTISGSAFPEDVVAFSYEAGGDDLGLEIATVESGVMRMSITHFSGAGAGTPDPGAGAPQPSNPYRRMLSALEGQYIANGFECVDGREPVGEFLVEWYGAMFESQVLPLLEQAGGDDQVLSDAIAAFLEWVHARHRYADLLCSDLVDGLETVEADGVQARERAARLLSTGVENAIDTAARVCASSHDLGEVAHMSDWAQVGELLRFVDTEIEPSRYSVWPDLASERILGCLTFEVEFESTIELSSAELLFVAPMKSTVPDVVHQQVAQLLGSGEEDLWSSAAIDYRPSMERYPVGYPCEAVVKDASAGHLTLYLQGPPIDEPQRNVKIFQRGSTGTPAPEPEPPSDGPTVPEFRLLVRELTGSEYFDLPCSDLWGGPNLDGAWGPFYFNLFHEPDFDHFQEAISIELERGPGKLIGRAASEKTHGSGATEVTIINLWHAAKAP